MSGSTWTWVNDTIDLGRLSDRTLNSGPGNQPDANQPRDIVVKAVTLVRDGVIAVWMVDDRAIDAIALQNITFFVAARRGANVCRALIAFMRAVGDQDFCIKQKPANVTDLIGSDVHGGAPVISAMKRTRRQVERATPRVPKVMSTTSGMIGATT